MSGAVSRRAAHVDDPGKLIRTEIRNGVMLATIDMPGRTMNVFSWALMDALENLIERIRADKSISAAVLTSAKLSFLAGADLDMVGGFTGMADHASPAEVHETTGRLGRLFVRLEALPKPTVAAVNGLALGGGLEIAMACAYRIVPDDPRIQLGLPEIKLGLLPGGGGTQRMPRIVGIEKGIELLLSGASVAPREALKLGLVDELVGHEQLVPRALAVAAELAGKGAWRKLPQQLDPGPFDLADPGIVRKITEHFGYSEGVVERYPAYHAIVRAVVEGAHLPIEKGDDNEMSRFVDLAYDEARTMANMVRTLFLDRQVADKIAARVPIARDIGVCVKAAGKAAEDLCAALADAGLSFPKPHEVGNHDIVILSASGQSEERTGLRLVLLAGAEDRLNRGSAGIFLKASPQYGRVLEIVLKAPGQQQQATNAALVLARRMRATPFIHGGELSLLAKLVSVEAEAQAMGLDEQGILLAQALAASRFRAAGHIEDPRLADVGCVVSGAFPAFTGGPFNYLRMLGESEIAQRKARYGYRAGGLFG